jgi:hypothetical protein
LVEHLLCKQGVIGSIPFASTIISKPMKGIRNQKATPSLNPTLQIKAY